jgi:hypothetical protein
MPNHYGGGSGGASNRSTRGGGMRGVSRRGNQSVGFGPNASQTMQPLSTTSDVNLALGSILPAGSAITTQTKVTKGYFTGDTGLLTSNLIHTGSLSSTNQSYYFNVTNNHPLSSSVATQFAATFGHKGGSGSQTIDATGNETLIGETQAIYNQFATLVLPEGEVSGGFHISNQGTAGQLSAGEADQYIYVLVAQRARFKDELDYGNWTLRLKGFDSAGTATNTLELTDDSKNTALTAKNSIYGRKFNIVSGSNGNAYTSSAYKTYGHYYPEAGFMIFSGTELSASIPGPNIGYGVLTANTASFAADITSDTFKSSSGFAPNLDNTGNAKNALKLVNCLRGPDTEEQRFRSAEIQNKKSYFLTVPPEACNFSTNGTFVSGSQGKMRHKSMYGNPNVFITTVGLHRADGRLVAVAKLSTPVIKNFGVQTTIKVNLTY